MSSISFSSNLNLKHKQSSEIRTAGTISPNGKPYAVSRRRDQRKFAYCEKNLKETMSRSHSSYQSGGTVVPGLARAFYKQRRKIRESLRCTLAQYERFLRMEEYSIRESKKICLCDLTEVVVTKRISRREIFIQSLHLLHTQDEKISRVIRAAEILCEFRNEVDLELIEPIPIPELYHSSEEAYTGFDENMYFHGVDEVRTSIVNALNPCLEPHSGFNKVERRKDWERKQRFKVIEQSKKSLDPVLAKLLAQDVPRKSKPASCKRLRDNLVPHSEESDGDFSKFHELLNTLNSVYGSQFDDVLVSRIEGLFLVCIAVMRSVDSVHALNIILIYVKTHYSGSLVGIVQKYLSDFFFDELEPHSGGDGDWLGITRSALANWRLLTTHIAFKKIAYLCSCLVTLGLCERSNLTWNVCGIKIFSPAVMEKQVNAFDLLGAVVETVVFFVEGGHACFVSGSLAPLLFSDAQAREFDANYNLLLENINHVSTGNLQQYSDMDENGFALLLEKTIASAKQLSDGATGQWEKNIFSQRLTRLYKVRTDFNTTRTRGGLRESPYCVNFFGGSGVGKSSISAITMVVGLLSNGYSATDEVLVTLNETDKYMSNYKSHVNGVYLDDVNNTKADFVERAPTARIIELMNNVRQYAVVAEAEQKGKISVEPRWVNVTTNTKELGANQFSNEPVSIVRRAHVTVTVSVKHEFCSPSLQGVVGQMLDPNKVAEYYRDPETGEPDIPMVPDLWNLTVERAFPIPPMSIGGHDSIGYDVVKHKGEFLSNVGIAEFLDFVIEDSKVHFQRQKELVQRSNNLSEKIRMCPKCRRPTDICQCDCEPHSGYLVGVVAGNIADKFITRLFSHFKKESGRIDQWASKRLLELSQELEDMWFFQWTNWVPNEWLAHKWGKSFVLYAMRDEIMSDIRGRVCRAYVGMIACLFFSFLCRCLPLGILATLYLLWRVVVEVRVTRERVYEEILARNCGIPEAARKVRERAMKFILGALGAAAVVYTVAKIYQGVRASRVSPQGNLAPTCRRDVEERDAEANPWVGAAPCDELPNVHKQRTIVPADLANLAFKNTCHMVIRDGDLARNCDAFFVCSNVAVIPFHMWYVRHESGAPPMETMTATFTHGNNHMFTALLGFDHCYHIPDTDLCLVWVPNGGEWRDLREYFPVEFINPGPSLVVYRKPDGTRYDDVVWMDQVGMCGHSGAQFYGGYLRYNKPTFLGMCMAPLVSQSKDVYIRGFHLGGRAGTTIGCAGSINQCQIELGIQWLDRLPEVVLSHSTGTLEGDEYGFTTLSSNKVHAKSPVNFLDAHYNIKVFGSTDIRSNPISSVVTTPISALVEKHCGSVREHGPPNFYPRWKPWFESLKYSAFPSIGIPPKLLRAACDDYLGSILPILKVPGITKYARLLTRSEILSGIDGVRFIDAIPLNTSAGFPFSGAKKQFVEYLDATTERQAPIILDERFWNKVDECEEQYLRGERVYPIFKACLKDEPTKIGKDKVRVFQAAPLHLGLMIRKYYLPIVRLLSLYPLRSECAVGVNCQGPEWSQLTGHITHFGENRILAGDYSKYDLRMPAQMIFAAFGILITFASKVGYDERSLMIMKGIATDVAYAMTAYDGTLLQFIGVNPSGQNLTVYVNSIDNSLFLRAGFYSLYETGCRFRDACRVITYGDDFAGSVNHAYSKFNHISFAQFLSEHDIVLTMPDKKSVPTEYMQFKDVDFLKRRDVFHPNIGLSFGALDESSIYKSLHTVMKSKTLSIVEQCSLNLEGALREWFFHGKQIYEARRACLVKIADEAKLAVRGLDESYEDRARQWCIDYKWIPPDQQIGHS